MAGRSGPCQIFLVSRDFDGDAGSYRSGEAAISADGRWIAFLSEAQLTHDMPIFRSVFLSGPHGGTGEPTVSILSPDHVTDFMACSGECDEPSVSGDGRWVVFSSEAGDLTEDSEEDLSQVYLRDSHHDVSTRLLSAPGVEAGRPRISADGRWVAYRRDGVVVAHDLLTGVVVPVSVRADGTPVQAWNHAVSVDGRFVAFVSEAEGIVGGPAGPDMQVYARDMANGVTVLVSAAPSGAPADGECDWPSISADGRYVAFDSNAADLVAEPTSNFQVYRRDVHLGVTTLVSRADEGPGGREAAAIRPSMSADGRYVVYQAEGPRGIGRPGHPVSQALRHDCDTGRTVLVSATPDGRPGAGETFSPVISADGAVVAFNSTSPGLADGVGDDGMSHVLRWTAPEAAGALEFAPDAFVTTADGTTSEYCLVVAEPPAPMRVNLGAFPRFDEELLAALHKLGIDRDQAMAYPHRLRARTIWHLARAGVTPSSAAAYPHRFSALDITGLHAAGVSGEAAATYPDSFGSDLIVRLASAGVSGERAAAYPSRFSYAIDDLATLGVDGARTAAFPHRLDEFEVLALARANVGADAVAAYHDRFDGADLAAMVEAGVDADTANVYPTHYSGGDIAWLVQSGIAAHRAPTNRVHRPGQFVHLRMAGVDAATAFAYAPRFDPLSIARLVTNGIGPQAAARYPETHSTTQILRAEGRFG